jgi:hypothetical protein
MALRVGLLFESSPSQPFQPGVIASLLEEIDDGTRLARNDEVLTLVPFVRTSDDLAFSVAASGSNYAIEAAAMGPGGVVLRSPQNLASFHYQRLHAKVEFDRGMEAILSLSHVVVAIAFDPAWLCLCFIVAR